jgi:hypothetical protein
VAGKREFERKVRLAVFRTEPRYVATERIRVKSSENRAHQRFSTVRVAETIEEPGRIPQVVGVVAERSKYSRLDGGSRFLTSEQRHSFFAASCQVVEPKVVSHSVD